MTHDAKLDFYIYIDRQIDRQIDNYPSSINQFY